MAEAETGATSGMRAVTISREYGSGGGEIAARLATRLGWKLVDHEVVVEVARALGVTEAEAEAHDEHAENLVARVLYGLSALPSPVASTMPVSLSADSDVYDVARRKVVEGAVNVGQAVIVGRGAQVLLEARRDVLHVRIVAPLKQRIEYVMRREGLDHAAAETRIRTKDRDRVRFLLIEHHRDPSDAHLYDLVVNTAVLDLDSAVDLLALALERKAAALSAPPWQTGPGAGIGPYPEPPGNFSPEAPGDK